MLLFACPSYDKTEALTVIGIMAAILLVEILCAFLFTNIKEQLKKHLKVSIAAGAIWGILILECICLVIFYYNNINGLETLRANPYEDFVHESSLRLFVLDGDILIEMLTIFVGQILICGVAAWFWYSGEKVVSVICAIINITFFVLCCYTMHEHSLFFRSSGPLSAFHITTPFVQALFFTLTNAIVILICSIPALFILRIKKSILKTIILVPYMLIYNGIVVCLLLAEFFLMMYGVPLWWF